jgi:hypothetical protein
LSSFGFLRFSAPRNRNTNRNINRYAPPRAGSSDGFRRADAQWRGWRAAMRPRATSVDYNVKEQVIRSRIKRSSQRAVSRETPH